MNAPRLQTDRLILRAYAVTDFPAYAAQRADGDVMRHIGDGTTVSEEEAWSGFLKNPGSWEFLGFGSWAIETTGKFVGGIGYSDRKRNRGEDLKGVPEMGWSLVREAFGQGYATEALQAALEWGRESLGHIRVIALTSEDNVASMRVAEKCGFREFRRALSVGRPRVFFDRIL